ncbi:bifunctional arginine demethylase and lysyl-hydroxylase JMJD6 isoform X3 [Magallana gigas]|uniref:bifunctional arginine demethylase and lysyl-hydroxylase JMJD6 isoform X3 n=1 Tax=Magallana gigas TaxID=29159 RepID=UPI003341D8BC
MPFAPTLKLRSTGSRLSARGRNGSTPGTGHQQIFPSGARRSSDTGLLYNGEETSLTMGSKKKQTSRSNGTVSQNGTKMSNGVSGERKRRKNEDSTMVTKTVQMSAFIVIIIAFVIMYRTDFSSVSSSGQNSSPSLDSSQDSKASQNSIQTDSTNWRPASKEARKLYGSTKCTVDRRDASDLTVKEFEKEYRFKKPVIVRFPNGAKDWTNPKKWSLSSLKQEYGQWYVLSGNSLEIVRKGGNGDVQSSFTEFVDSLMQDKDEIGEPFYIFDRMFYNDSSLPRTLKPPKYFEIKDGIDDSIFFLGASSSGVSFHKHADAWNGVIYGQKRWFLYPTTHTPPGGVYPGFTQMEWYSKVYPSLTEDHAPMECVQEAGEILYLPEGTYHGTINLGDTVAIGIQKKLAATETEKLFYKELNLERAAPGANRDKLLQERIKIFKKLHKLLPDNTEVMMKLGQALADSGQIQDGMKFTQLAIDKDPHFLIAHLNKAKMHIQINEKQKAEEILKFTLKMNPKLWDIHATYGDFLMNNQRFKEAVHMYKKGTEVKTDLLSFLINA